MKAYLYGIRYYLPEGTRANEDLAKANEGWDAAKIFERTGIRSRRIAAAGETASDLGYRAAELLLTDLAFDRSKIDALVFCSQAPDYFMPTTACVLQERLGLPSTCGAFDYNLGCSGFTYGLWLSRALIVSGTAQNVLLVNGDTPSKYCDPQEVATVTIFGDGGTAALVSADPGRAAATVGPSVVGTDGRGAENLIVRAGGARLPKPTCHRDIHLYMNGAEIATFTLRTVKSGIQQLLNRIGLGWQDIDLFFFHQANAYILTRLRSLIGIPAEKAPIDMEDIGNTGGASVPILIRRCQEKGMLRDGQRCVLAGFGVGYSWAMTFLTWGPEITSSA